MGMARRTIGKDELMLRAMVGGERMTVGTLIWGIVWSGNRVAEQLS
jgi:hypothetical protein